MITLFSLCYFHCLRLSDNRFSDAVIRNDYKAIEVYLKNGHNVNNRGREGLTPLMWAVFNKNYYIVKLLLEKGANPNIKDKKGQTALMYLIQNDNNVDTLISLLLQKGAEINAKNISGTTALIIALDLNKSDAAKSLIEKGADVSIVNELGDSPLNIATKNCDFNNVCLILSRLKERNITVIEEAIEIAKKNDCYSIKEQLLKVLK